MKVIVDDIATEYVEQGKGPVVLLLHGWGDSLHTFDALSPLLVDKYELIALDLPGFGATEAPKETWDISSYVMFVNHFCEKLGIKPTAIIGHSFGGRVAIKGLSTKELVAEKLVLIGSAGLAKTGTTKNILLTIMAKIFGLITFIPPMLFYRDKIRKRAYKFIGSDYYDAGTLKDTYLAAIHEDLSQYASKLTLPTLLIWGENDSATPLADGQKLSFLIQGSRLEVVMEAGHFVHQEKSYQVAQLMKGFLK